MASLSQPNKYLATEAMRLKVVRLSLWTSSAIDGIRYPTKSAKPPNAGSRPKRKNVPRPEET